VDYIIKADVQGSVEAVRDAIAALATERVVPRVVYAAAGPITTSDIHLAAATGAHLVAFNLKPPAADIEASLKQSSVEVMSHQVIYHLLDAVGRHMEAASGGPGGAGGREVVVGSATVLQLVPLLKKGKEVGQVVGCRVLDGSLSMEGRNVYRLVREGEVVWEGSCSSLRRQKEDVASVEKAQECGVVLGEGDSSVKVEPGDVLQCVARPVA
jgi:translation initiation factor IF-2